MGPRGLQELSWEFGPLFGGPFWAHLGLILGYLGPSLALLGGFQEGTLRQMLGLEGLILGCLVAKS